MNLSTSRNGIAAGALLLAFAAAAPTFGQSPPTTKPQERPQQGSNAQGQQGQQGMEQIASAYRQLHSVTLSTLQDKARSWNDTPTAGAARGTDPKATTLSLRGDELLIAACAKGLLAGAPSGTPVEGRNEDTRKTTPPAGDARDQSTQPDPDRSGPSGGSVIGDGQSVGMILVHANASVGVGGSTSGHDGSTQKSDRAPREVSDDSTRNSSGILAAGLLKPGVYCVKQSGASVWLTDQSGQVVLRTTLDGQFANKVPMTDEVGGRERQAGVAAQRTGNHGDWEQVFGAITKEAMSSMGWAKQGAVASMR